VGSSVGSKDVVGVEVGELPYGFKDGRTVGHTLGAWVGSIDGYSVGLTLGYSDGTDEG